MPTDRENKTLDARLDAFLKDLLALENRRHMQPLRFATPSRAMIQARGECPEEIPHVDVDQS